MKTVAMLGHGAFGTAMATVLSTNGHRVLLWCYEAEDVPHIIQTRCNTRYLPNIELAQNVVPIADLGQAIQQAEIIIEAIPVLYLRSVLELAQPFTNNQPWVLLSKGIEQNTLLFPSQLVGSCIGSVATAVCAGPNFAHEIAEQKISAATVASKDATLAQEVAALFTNSYFKTQLSSDPIGAQVGGACKNVYSIGIGILRALKASENSIAFFITSALHEMSTLSAAIGGASRTIFGLSGIGDLSLSLLGTQSRNVGIGITIAQGVSLDEIKKSQTVLPEGINSIQSINALAQQHKIHLPLASAIESIVFNQKNPSHLLKTLRQ